MSILLVLFVAVIKNYPKIVYVVYVGFYSRQCRKKQILISVQLNGQSLKHSHDSVLFCITLYKTNAKISQAFIF